MKIHFAVQTHNFQQRLRWQLSSILQQIGDVPDITVDVAYLPNNGKPYTTEEILQTFQREGLAVVHTKYLTEKSFGYRGLVRNRQIKNAIECEAEWMFFADCDHLYPPTFFIELASYLRMTLATNCIASIAKKHTEVAATEKKILGMEDENVVVIPFAFANAASIPMIEKSNKNVAAGCMQVVSLKAIVEKNSGLYISPDLCRDSHMIRQGQRAKSDIQFRRAMGGTTRILLPKQIHLNHRRDKEEGRHLEEQR